MRRPALTIFSVLLATVLASTALFFAYPDSSEARPEAKLPGKFKGLQKSPTQIGPPGKSRKTDRVDVLKEDYKPYSQVVGNARFRGLKATGWKKRASKPGAYGEDYRVSGSGVSGSGRKGKAARFKVEVPATDVYTVFAWWPTKISRGTTARFGVSTTTGVEWSTVDQSKDGGYWTPIGTYRMKKGKSYVRIQPGSGKPVVADTVAVVRGVLDFPPDPPPKKGKKSGGKETSSGEDGRIFGSATSEGSFTDEAFAGGASFTLAAATRSRATPRAIMRRAKYHIGTPYGNNRCRRTIQEDCSCFTRLVFYKWRRLPDSPRWQWRYGVRIPRANTKRGDLVFFDIDRDGVLEHWDHVGIYAGNGYIIHANSYYKYRKVHLQKMRWVRGYWGTKRIR